MFKALQRILASGLLIALLLTAQSGFAQDLTTAKAVLRANLEATGGYEAWSGVKSLHNESEMAMDLDMGSIVMKSESWIIIPGHMFMKTKALEAPANLPEGALDNTIFVSPEGGFVEGMQGRQSFNELPGQVQDQLKSGMKINDEWVMLSQPDSTIELLDSKEINGAMTYAVLIKGAAETTRYYDQESLLLIAVEATGPSGEITRGIISDYRNVDGFLLPFHTETDMGATGTQTLTVKVFKLNPEITIDDLSVMAGVRQ